MTSSQCVACGRYERLGDVADVRLRLEKERLRRYRSAGSGWVRSGADYDANPQLYW
jgi:hypothetical protein